MRAGGIAGESGYTLLEVVIVVALLALVAGGVCESLARQPEQTRATETAFAELVDQARSLAALNAASPANSGGASIGVERQGDTYVATLYADRPLPGAPAPQAVERTAPLRTFTAIALGVAGGSAEPPFALFFSSSGHVSAQPGFRIGAATLATEPACPLDTGIPVRFGTGDQRRTFAVSCELAQLELDR